MKKPFLKAVSLVVCVLFVFQTTAFAVEEILFYHTDPVGTPLAMSNMSGQKVWEADYKPFGEEFSTGGSKGNSKRFVGKEKDSETGLNYFGARYLSGPSGRFLAPDPVRAVDVFGGNIHSNIVHLPQRINLYSYALNNPSKYVDPDGKQPQQHMFDAGNLNAGVGGIAFRGNSRVITDPRRLLPHPEQSSTHTQGGAIESFRVGKQGLYIPRGRAHGERPLGGFLSEKPIPNQQYVRKDLATKPEWNPATKVSDAYVPEGVVLQRSIAGAQGQNYPGGGPQLEILNRADKAKIIYSNPRTLLK